MFYLKNALLSKKPRSAADYERYTDILPSKKATSTYKNKKTLHQEIRAANLLMNKKDDVEVTMHHDTTSRSKIDGDWPSIISNFMSDNKDECAMVTFEFNLSSLFTRSKTKLLP